MLYKLIRSKSKGVSLISCSQKYGSSHREDSKHGGWGPSLEPTFLDSNLAL